MSEMFYAVQALINGRAGTRPTAFTSKDDAISFADILNDMKVDGVNTEVHVYEVTEIEHR